MSFDNKQKVLIPAFNDLKNDYRVFRTASTVVEMGHKAQVVGVEYPQSPPVQPWGDGIELIRLPVKTTAGA